MNRPMLILSLLTLALIGGSAGLLSQVRTRQALAPPGVKTHGLPGSIRLQADLPEHVLDYQSKWVEVDDVTLSSLPKDTSFGARHYTAPDDFAIDLRVVLMGRDRTSMHKPQLCLTGQGWRIDQIASQATTIWVERPTGYDLPVVELVANKPVSINGQNQSWSGVYVYWYVAEDALSASTSGWQRMWLMSTKLLRTGVLQRWAYVSCFSPCAPGEEAATFGRLKQFIAASVPEFQLYPKLAPLTVTTTR